MARVDQNSALMLIDVQKAWKEPVWGRRNNPGAEDAMERVLGGFRRSGLGVIHVRHESPHPKSLFYRGRGTFGFDEKVMPLPGEMVITKNTNSAFIGTGLEEILHSLDDPEVYIAGLVTDHCVSSSARMSGNLGFETFVIDDACATFERKSREGNAIPPETVHAVNLSSIDREFARVMSSSELEF